MVLEQDHDRCHADTSARTPRPEKFRTHNVDGGWLWCLEQAVGRRRIVGLHETEKSLWLTDCLRLTTMIVLKVLRIQQVLMAQSVQKKAFSFSRDAVTQNPSIGALSSRGAKVGHAVAGSSDYEVWIISIPVEFHIPKLEEMNCLVQAMDAK